MIHCGITIYGQHALQNSGRHLSADLGSIHDVRRAKAHENADSLAGQVVDMISFATGSTVNCFGHIRNDD